MSSSWPIYRRSVIVKSAPSRARICPAPHSREYLERIFEGLAALGPRVIAVTGVRDGAGRIGTVVLERETGRRYAAMREELGGVFYGTGDIFASAFAALLTRGACVAKSLELASALVAESIGYTYRQGTPRRDGVAFELALPNYVRRVGEAFWHGTPAGI